ncbi:NAD(P)H-dependent flavin oxidoreductase [Peristeroidobacter agariperforans]|uniref:NAD(P)H-dependent flavin oxidoreductase n=1 Tax=Peristeroidobacter agariperforans TaxID=268404 RepID=UPI00101DE984|nr:nitronate monooxygenase [Peristeroidobacter agariperforans]
MSSTAQISRDQLSERVRTLRVPLVVAPMFLVSSPKLVVAACKAGAIGSMPTLNAKTPEQLDDWLALVRDELSWQHSAAWPVAPYALNVLMHQSNARLPHDLEAVRKHRPPIVIASVGRPDEVVDIVHEYGGLVLADVGSLKHAKRAADSGVDGLVLLCAGAGGQTGRLNPFAFVEATRRFFSGLIAVAGGITHGRHLAALQRLGADLGYSGTSFIATPESLATDDYKKALLGSDIDDVWDTDAISGIPANVLRATLTSLGLQPETRWVRTAQSNYDWSNIRWRPDLYSAGHGVGEVRAEEGCATIIGRFSEQYKASSLAGSTS